MKCDANLPRTWYRFTGPAGAVMPTHCVLKLHCGALSPGWLNGKHPIVEEGVVERMVCFTNNDDCCFWYSKIRVRNCSDFMVYNFGEFPASQPFCSLRYCGVGKTGKQRVKADFKWLFWPRRSNRRQNLVQWALTADKKATDFVVSILTFLNSWPEPSISRLMLKINFFWSFRPKFRCL